MQLVILPGQSHKLAGMLDLLESLPFGVLIGDKAFDAEWLLGEVRKCRVEAVIPSRRNRTKLRDHEREMSKWRHQIKNLFARIKGFRATRYDKVDENFASAIDLVEGVVAAN